MRFTAAAVSAFLAASPLAAQGFDWSGAYAGLALGAVRSDVDLSFPGTAFMGDHNGSGAIVAAQVGHNWILPSGLVVGAELDAAAGKVDSAGPLMFGAVAFEHWPVEISNPIALRAKIGWVTSSSTLIYGALGASRASLDGDIYNDLAGTVFRESYSATATGVTAAIGVEHPIRDNVTVRSELRHTRYQSEAFDPPGTIPFEVEARTTEFRIGFNWHF